MELNSVCVTKWKQGERGQTEKEKRSNILNTLDSFKSLIFNSLLNQRNFSRDLCNLQKGQLKCI